MFNFQRMFEISPRWLNRNTPDKVAQAYMYRYTHGNTHTVWSKHLWDALLFLKHKAVKRNPEKRRGKHLFLAEKLQQKYNSAALVAWCAKAAELIDSFPHCCGIYHLSCVLQECRLRWFLTQFVCIYACISVLHTFVAFLHLRVHVYSLIKV